MPLKLSLKPGEAVVVNGAVVRNGDRRGTLVIENQARVLREKDILSANDIETPVHRTYFVLMQMYLLGETEGPLFDEAMAALCDVAAFGQSKNTKEIVLSMARQCAVGDVYGALSQCRKMMAEAATKPKMAPTSAEIRAHG